MTWADRGSVSVEVAILAPAFLALVALAGVTGRTAVAHEAIEVAAHEAARAASISRTADEARDAAEDAVLQRLAGQGYCAGSPELDVTGTTAGEEQDLDDVFASDLGVDATVVVTVGCRVPVGNLRMPLVPGVPEHTYAEATFASPLDRYRARSGQ
ncbi:TadE/TadG family type IV pilus assembly protein [Plantactinospora sonchi]|uniref:TadE/TadG family type IV pilus assembly protein n=1 Tax=Plantactinospora sonchi TaxID=1544735 RepID=A0ABU7RNW6_9ACTN